MRRIVIPALALIAALLSASSATGGTSPQPADVNCDGTVNAVDALGILRHVAGLTVNQQPGCLSIGDDSHAAMFGDTNCDQDISSVDALFILRFVAAIIGLLDCATTGLLPEEVQGVELERTVYGGNDFIEQGDGIDQVLDAMGKAPEDVSVAIAVPTDRQELDFQMGALRIRNNSAADMLGEFIADIEGASGGAIDFEQVSLGGKSVTRGIDTTDPSTPPMYYYATEDTLVFIQSPDEDAVSEALAGLPAGTATNSGAAAQGVVNSGAVRSVSVAVLQKPDAICVGYEPELIRTQIYFTHPGLRYAVPMPWFSVATTAQLGAVEPAVHTGRHYYEFTYDPSTRGDEAIEIQVTTQDPVGEGSKTLDYDVQLCLSGNWEDGSRTLKVIHTGDLVGAEIISGTLVCGVQGRAFSGELDGNILSGDDVLVCNPESCVDEGKLPQTEKRPFDGIVSDDAEVIGITWIERHFDGDCQETGTSESHFNIHRQTFEEPRPH